LQTPHRLCFDNSQTAERTQKRSGGCSKPEISSTILVCGQKPLGMATDDKKETHPLVQPGGERSLPLKKVTYKALIKYKIELSVQSRLG